jgi:hypothetical protein
MVASPPADVVRACVVAAGCSPFFQSFTVSTCIAKNVLSSFGGTGCLANAKTCADAQLCTGSGFSDAAACAGKAGWVCDGDIARNCSEHSFQVDCQKLGGKCSLPSTGKLPDGVNPCKVLDSCAETDAPAFHCAGAAWYTCVGGVGYGQLCSASNAACKDLKAGAQCVYVTGSCTSPGTAACNGQRIELCTSDSLPVAYDCAKSGLECASPTTAQAECLAPGCTIGSLKACEESCDGNTLHTCVGGVPLSLSCADYGFSACRSFSGADFKGSFCTTF